MSRILIIYSTTDGHTLEICEAIQARLAQAGNSARLVNIDEVETINPQDFDKVVIGARIRYGKHQPSVYDFIRRHEKVLDDRPSAFFSVNVVARKPEKNSPETNPYMQKFLSRVNWQPDELAVFAGKIDYKKYRFFDRQMIRFIMYLTHGPTHPDAEEDFTNWQQVERFADTIDKMETSKTR